VCSHHGRQNFSTPVEKFWRPNIRPAPVGKLPTGAVPFPRGGSDMLTHGNHKLGARRIWSFSLPFGPGGTSAGMTPVCGNHCYALALESYRPAAVAVQNLAKCEGRFGELPVREPFDAKAPDGQRFPRRFLIDFATTHDKDENSFVRVFYQGRQFGNELSDNSYGKDG
jgi:hypothetical protein